MGSITTVKTEILAILGIMFAWICNLMGGADSVLIFLLILMVADYITGLTLALVFKKSPKTENGAISSNAGFKGICKKIIMLVMVLIAYRADLMLGLNYIRSATILAFIINELVSFTENVGLMGVPLPNVLKNLIDILREKEKGNDKIN